jgi:DNA-binding MarR family transcriptional regulator
MEKVGLIQRKNDAKDERLTVLQITPKGIKDLEEIRNIQGKHVTEYLQTYSQEQKEEVLTVLKNIVRKGRPTVGEKS